MDIEYEKAVGRNLRQIRKSKKLTQEMLAAKLQVNNCDLTRSAIAKIEVGQRHLYIDELKLIAKILKVDVSEILID